MWEGGGGHKNKLETMKVVLTINNQCQNHRFKE